MSARSALSARSRSSRVFFRSFSSIFVTSVPKARRCSATRDSIVRTSRSFSSRILIFADTSQRAPGGARIFSHARAMSSSDDPANVDASRPGTTESLPTLSSTSAIWAACVVFLALYVAVPNTLNTKDAGQKRRGSPPRCRSRPRWAPAAPRPPWRRPRARRA